jgi:hypothetical protein
MTPKPFTIFLPSSLLLSMPGWIKVRETEITKFII